MPPLECEVVKLARSASDFLRDEEGVSAGTSIDMTQYSVGRVFEW